MKALVVAGGNVPPGLLREELARSDLVVCADGGARHLEGTGRLPDLLVGDMDSIAPEQLRRLEAACVEVIRAKQEKDETDAQLAVDEAIRRGASEIVFLGALGGRIDHALGNLMLMVCAAEKGVKAVIRDDSCEVFAATGSVEITGRAGETVSLLPAGSGVSVRYLDGFKYGTKEPLPLPIDSPIGVSNVLTAEKAHAEITDWTYIIHLNDNETA